MNLPTSPVRGSRFRSNIVRIATGTMASQVLVIGSTPVLTRLFNPEAFGALAVFTALNAVLAGLFTLKYDLSIILPSDPEEAMRLTALTMSTAAVLATLLLVGLAIARWLLGTSIPWHLLLLPVSIVLAAGYTCIQQWAARSNDYARFSRSQIVGAAVNVSVSVLIGLAAASPVYGLIAGWVSGMAGSVAYANAGRWHRAMSTRLDRAQLWKAAHGNRRFPHFVLPSWLVQTLGNSAQPFILQALFSLRDVGHYAIANRFMFVPSTLIGSAIAEAFRAEFVERIKRGEDVRRFFRATLSKMVLMGLPVFLLLLVTAPALFEIAFGAQYREAGTLARYLCAGVMAQFVAQPFAYVFVATGHVRRGLLIQIATTAVPLLAIVLGGLRGDMALAFTLASATSLVLSGLLIALAYQSCRVPEELHA